MPLINSIFHWLHKNNFKLENNSVQLMVKDFNDEEDSLNNYDRYNNRNLAYLPDENIKC